jgi:hypothetical protein
MSCLDLTRRPTVIFNAANVEHRKAVEQFLRTGTWGGIDVNFLLETPYYDLPAMISAKLANYYLQREFTSKKESKHDTRIEMGQSYNAVV